MNHWDFILAAYAVTTVATGGLIAWALVTMRRAEAAAEQLKRK